MKKIVILLAFIATIYSCTHNPVSINNGNGDGTGIPCNPDTVYFKNEILPIILSNCAMSGCHDATTNADGVTLTNYETIIKTGEVKAFKPNSSDLYESITETSASKRMPLNLPALSSVNINKIKKWIEQGAKNNACESCDTTLEITYSATISTLIQNNCVGCHNASNASANIDLSTYSGLKKIADDGKLIGTVTQQTGFKPMPPAAKLDDCIINKIIKWKNNGAQNN